MADLLLHLIAPAIALFAFYDRKYIRWVVALALLTIVPAVDHLPFLFTYARALLHNVFELVPFALIAGYGWWRKRETLKHIGIIGGFYWASHIILDLDGVRMLWPISNQIFVWNMNVPMGAMIMVPTGIPTMLAITSMSFYALLVYVVAFVISVPNVRRTYRNLWAGRDREVSGTRS
jgi:hypothetical protein